MLTASRSVRQVTLLLKLLVTVPTQHSTAFTIEIPATSRHPKATQPQASRSQKDASQASDDGGLAARVAAAERRQDELEKLVGEMEHKLRSLKKLGA